MTGEGTCRHHSWHYEEVKPGIYTRRRCAKCGTVQNWQCVKKKQHPDRRDRKGD